jgi:hypothetical protein
MAERSSAPASLRRAFFFLILGAAVLPVAVRAQRPFRPPPGYVQLGKPDQAEGRRILDQFRAAGAMGIAGDYYLGFELRVMPREGAERTFAGNLWGGRNDQGTIERVTLGGSGTGLRLLVQNGQQAAVWNASAEPGAPVTMLGVAALFVPLAGTDLTPFDLQMPYLYWPDFVYEGVAKIRGRPAYQFLLYPPADFTAQYPALTGVRIYLDTQYRQPVQTEQIGPAGRLLKSLMLQELKKIGDQWIPKTVDLRDETTRNKTRFSVTAAALNQNFPGDFFAPTALSGEGRPPAVTGLVSIPP